MMHLYVLNYVYIYKQYYIDHNGFTTCTERWQW